MVENFIVTKDKYLSKILLFDEIDLSNQVNLLFGSNGVGKSTLINALLSRIYDKDNYKVEINKRTIIYSYINSEQNARKLDNPMFSMQDLKKIETFGRFVQANELSEGQSIIYTIQELLWCAKNTDKEVDNVFIIDEVDSGLSVDNIVWLCEEIKKITKENKNVQFIISFNNYEFCEQFKEVVSMYTGKKQTINTYEEYKEELLKWRPELLKIRNNNQFILYQ